MEEWRRVDGFSGYYEVSNLGRVKRLSRMSKGGYWLPERILAGYTNQAGYHVVHLCGEYANKIVKVHRLVANAFLPLVPGKTDVNHINGIKNDNRLENLEWCNDHENILHAYRVLNRVPDRLGKPSWHRKLSEDQVRSIRADTRVADEIKKDYGVCRETIYNVKRGVFYANVE